MTAMEALEKLLPSYEAYYNINREEVIEPFIAEAEFYTHDESYFLIKEAKMNESESREFVYFYATDRLDAETLKKLDETAWNAGMSRVVLSKIHYSTDVALVIMADTIEKDAEKLIKKLKHHKSYCFNFKGFSRYRLIALETSTSKITYNHLGFELKKLIRNILK